MTQQGAMYMFIEKVNSYTAIEEKFQKFALFIPYLHLKVAWTRTILISAGRGRPGLKKKSVAKAGLLVQCLCTHERREVDIVFVTSFCRRNWQNNLHRSKEKVSNVKFMKIDLLQEDFTNKELSLCRLCCFFENESQDINNSSSPRCTSYYDANCADAKWKENVKMILNRLLPGPGMNNRTAKELKNCPKFQLGPRSAIFLLSL